MALLRRPGPVHGRSASPSTAALEEKKSAARLARSTPGGHTWPVWKNDLYLFSQRLFGNAVHSAAEAQAPRRSPRPCAQAAFPRRTPTPNDTLKSTEVAPDHKVTFRIYAPKASEVSVGGDFGRAAR